MRIVITGRGVVSALGIGKQATIDALEQQHSGVHSCGAVPYDDAALAELCGIHTPASRSVLLALPAAREALAEAHVQEDVAFFSGTTVAGMNITEQHWNDWQQGAPTDLIRHHESGACSRQIASLLGLDGPVVTPSTACSSALNAIMAAADYLRSGQATCCLAGGTEALSEFHQQGFRSLMIIDDELCRPFSATRHGLNLGEGAGYLVLETEEHARARGAKIIAWLDGYANACDAYHQTASSPDGEGAYRAMQQAMQMAHLQPDEIDYVNLHGTGTESNDSSEATALTRLFGEHLPPASSTKSLTGHTTSASGGIEAVICLLALEEGLLPAGVRVEEPILSTLVQRPQRQVLRHVMCNAFGFGGNDSVVIFSAEQGTELSSLTLPMLTPRVVVARVCPAHLTPMQARRLTPGMRRLTDAALEALQQAGIEYPNAIIAATRWGCIVQSVRFLSDLLASDESAPRPTDFMQSTHNTPASSVAILCHAHGYNTTYSDGDESLTIAQRDAAIQLASGRVKSVLVLYYDELEPTWQALLARVGITMEEHAEAYVYMND